MYTTTTRLYYVDGTFADTIVYESEIYRSARRVAQEDYRINSSVEDGVLLPTNPCNISVRGPNGKFRKWKVS